MNRRDEMLVEGAGPPIVRLPEAAAEEPFTLMVIPLMHCQLAVYPALLPVSAMLTVCVPALENAS